MFNYQPPPIASPALGSNPSALNRQTPAGLAAPGLQSHPITTMLPGLNTAGINPMVTALRGNIPAPGNTQGGPTQGTPGGRMPSGLPAPPTQLPGMMGAYPPGFQQFRSGMGLGLANNPWMQRL
jgi:hypothetical protein